MNDSNFLAFAKLVGVLVKFFMEFVFYEKELSLDPRNKGAHEYIGELYLKLKQPEKAKEHLAKLDSICFFGCEEFDELKEPIQAYEKNN